MGYFYHELRIIISNCYCIIAETLDHGELLKSSAHSDTEFLKEGNKDSVYKWQKYYENFKADSDKLDLTDLTKFSVKSNLHFFAECNEIYEVVAQVENSRGKLFRCLNFNIE